MSHLETRGKSRRFQIPDNVRSFLMCAKRGSDRNKKRKKRNGGHRPTRVYSCWEEKHDPRKSRNSSPSKATAVDCLKKLRDLLPGGAKVDGVGTPRSRSGSTLVPINSRVGRLGVIQRQMTMVKSIASGFVDRRWVRARFLSANAMQGANRQL